jgi:uracil-DNA glycosylase family protein
MDAERPGAGRWVVEGAGVDQLRVAAGECRGCELHGPATQVVFSTGSPVARVALVGEQPGDAEDRQGAPFVGPAGRLLDRALADAGIDRADCYVTNAVKHFRFKPTPKRRLHQTPAPEHIAACRPWLVAELAVVDPEVLVCLGATAGRALFGPTFRITRQRGILYPRPPRHDDPAQVRAGWMLGTVHPSAVLRADDEGAAYAALVRDLRVAAAALGQTGPRGSHDD